MWGNTCQISNKESTAKVTHGVYQRKIQKQKRVSASMERVAGLGTAGRMDASEGSWRREVPSAKLRLHQ